MSLSHSIEYGLLRFVQAVLLQVPQTRLRIVARWLATAVFTHLRYRRSVTLDNLRFALPELSDRDRRDIARQAYESAAITFLEFITFHRWTKESFSPLFTCANPEVLRNALDDSKGVIVLTAHFGSWEVYGQAPLFILSKPGSLLAKVQSNPLVDGMVDRLRRQFGNATVPSNTGVRDVLRTLQSGGWVIIAADQSAPRESVSVKFFGRMVSTFQGPAVFALRTGAAIVFGAAVRQGDGTYLIHYERIRHDDLHGATDENVRILTERHTAKTEELIRSHPGQWMWMHRRWKHPGRLDESGHSS